MTPTKRAWIILVAILALELIPFTLILAGSRRGVLGRLYGLDPAHALAWVAALAIAVAYAAYAARAFPLIRDNLLTWSSLKAAAIPFAIVTGTVEEVYFRKFAMDWMAHHGAVAAGQVAASAILFGAAHGIWGLFARQWRMALGAAAATGVLGALLALVYLAAGRDVAPCIWAHMLINLTIEPWLILAAASAASAPRQTPAVR
jgi:hypothetical protein